MASPTVDRRFGLVGNMALKAPVAAIATSNITLSGQQTIDGVALLAINASGIADRVLVAGQTDATQNGIYDVSLNAWSRSADADGPYDFAQGSMVLVNGGTTNQKTVWMLVTTGAITIGTSAQTWQIAIGASMLSALLAAQSAAAAAALSEAQAAAIVLGNFLQSGTGAQARTFTSKDRESVSVKDFGAIGDGANHLLSTRYATLVAAQVDYPFVTSLNQSIDYAAFQAAHNSLSASNSAVGGRILVPPGSYFLSNTWKIDKRVNIVGSHQSDQTAYAASSLTFPADTDGVRVYSDIDSPNGTVGAYYTHIEGLNITASAKNVSGIGIWATCVVNIERCVVRSFKGHGIYIHGQTGGGATGIADAWSVSHVRSASNGGDGLRIEGNDSNVGTAIQVECSSNGGYGYYDIASYCNTYIACQAAGNTTAPFYSRNGTNLASVYIGCYTELTGVYTSDFDSNVVVYGGVMVCPGGSSLNGGSAGLTVNLPLATPRAVFASNNGVEIGRLETDGIWKNFKGYQALNGGLASTVTPGIVALVATGTAADDRMRFDNGNGRVGSISTSGSATAYNTSSDYRLKENVQLLSADAIDRIMRLRPVKYTWKVDGSEGEGFIAHELQEVFPQAVTGEKDAVELEPQMDEAGEPVLDAQGLQVVKEVPRFQGVDVSFLVGPIVAMLQQHQRDIAALNTKFDAYVAAHP